MGKVILTGGQQIWENSTLGQRDTSPARSEEHNPKNLIIFGAGASYGSGNVKPCPPPTGDKLFEKLARQFPCGWGRITGGLKNTFENDFEKGMVELGKSSPQDMVPLQKNMAEYFFKYSLGPNNLYSKLAYRINPTKWDGAFVTLNYERLLMKGSVRTQRSTPKIPNIHRLRSSKS